MPTSHPLSMTGIVCRMRWHSMSEYEIERDVARCWCGAHSITKSRLFAGSRAPWLTQPGWQVAVGTRTPRIFRARQALAHIFRR